MKQRNRKHRRPVREAGLGRWVDPFWSNVILLAPSKFDEIKIVEPGEVPPNLLRGEIGVIDCAFRILPLVPVDPSPKPA